MTLTAWDIYWVTRLDEISIALGLAIPALLIVLALSTFVYFVTDFEINGAKKTCVRACPVDHWVDTGEYAHPQHQAGRRDDRAPGDCQLGGCATDTQ